MPKRKQPPLWQRVPGFIQNHFRSITGLVLLALIAASVTLGVQWLQDPYRFPLRVVKVDGDFRYLDRTHLQQAVAPFVQGGFFTVDVASICNTVEALPWVYKATVTRDWPDRLIVHIEEQEPVARWGGDGFLNRFGEAFTPEQEQVATVLPRLSGPEGHEQTVLEKYQRMTKLLAPLGLQLARVELDERRAWHLEMDNGVQLELGRADIWQRLQRFVRTWPEVFAGHPDGLQRVDLRYSNGYSVYWQQADASKSVGKGQEGQGSS
jgi:cell division protein FtsQ